MEPAPRIVNAYNIMMLANPCAKDAHSLSRILHSKKSMLRKFLEVPPIQSTPTGFFCQDLQDYLGRIRAGVNSELGSKSVREYVLEHVVRNAKADKETTEKFCEIFGFDLPEAVYGAVLEGREFEN
jgi:hypothetical protein